MHAIYNNLPTHIEGFNTLAELALDMRWSWNHSTDDVWRRLDPQLWQITHNPWVVLHTAPRDRIAQMLADPEFRKNADGLAEDSRPFSSPGCGSSMSRWSSDTPNPAGRALLSSDAVVFGVIADMELGFHPDSDIAPKAAINSTENHL